LNWTVLKITDDKTEFQVKQWNSLQIDVDRKFYFLKIFQQVESITLRMSWGRGRSVHNLRNNLSIFLDSCSYSTTTGLYSTVIERINHATTTIRPTI